MFATANTKVCFTDLKYYAHSLRAKQNPSPPQNISLSNETRNSDHEFPNSASHQKRPSTHPYKNLPNLPYASKARGTPPPRPPFPFNMGRLAEGTTAAGVHKPRFLCLHGFRTSGAIMKTQVVGKWPEKVTSRLDLVFADAPFPAEGKSDVDGIFDPPYYEWFQFDKDFMTYTNFDECLAYIEELMIKLGPFDGLMGFSQGAILSAALPGLQAKGLALTRVPKIKYLMIISGAKFASPELAEKAYSSKIACPSLHFLGETDFLNEHGKALLKEFIDPLVIRHPRGHTVPRLDDKSLQVMLEYLEKIEKDLPGDGIETAEEFAENI